MNRITHASTIRWLAGASFLQGAIVTSGSTTPAGDTRELPPRRTGETGPLEKFVYNDAVVRAFLMVTVLWGVVALLVGLIVALELVLPSLSLGLPYLSFGRLRPLHTNAAIFAFAGNAIFAADLSFHAAALQGPDVQRLPQLVPFLGLAIDHRGGRGHAAAGLSRSRRNMPSWNGPSTWRSPSCGWPLPSTSSARSSPAANATCTWPCGSTSPRS